MVKGAATLNSTHIRFMAVLFFVGLGAAGIAAQPSAAPSTPAEILTRTLDLVQSNASYDNLPAESELVASMLRGLVEALPDQHAAVMEFGSDGVTNGDSNVAESSRAAGIGVTLESDSYGRLIVSSVFPDTPADRVGILPGDHLLRVGSVPTIGAHEWEIHPLLAGPPNSQVYIAVETPGEGPRELLLDREPVVPVEISIGHLRLRRWKADPSGEWAWIRVRWFEDPSTLEAWNAVIQEVWSSESVQGLILDLRDNGGGHNSCISMLGDLFTPGDELAVFENRLGDNHWQQRISNTFIPRSRLIAYPLVVLVNGRTASMAELFAATLQEQRHITVIGERTFGKGTTQTWLAVSDTIALRLTVGVWFTPEGKYIDGLGVEPDVQMADNPRTGHIDEQLLAAVEALKAR